MKEELRVGVEGRDDSSSEGSKEAFVRGRRKKMWRGGECRRKGCNGQVDWVYF